MDVFKPDQPRSNIVDIGYMNMKPDNRCDITSEQVSQAFYVGVSSTEFTTSFFWNSKTRARLDNFDATIRTGTCYYVSIIEAFPCTEVCLVVKSPMTQSQSAAGVRGCL